MPISYYVLRRAAFLGPIQSKLVSISEGMCSGWLQQVLVHLLGKVIFLADLCYISSWFDVLKRKRLKAL